MTTLFVFAQLGDLFSYLWALYLHPELAQFEIGPIGAIWIEHGPVVAASFKISVALGVLCTACLLSARHSNYTRGILAVGSFAGMLGIVFNLLALASVA